MNVLKNKMRFVQEIIDEKLVIFKQDDDELVKRMEERKFDKDEKNSYDYLLNIQARSFTLRKIQELNEEIVKYETLVDNLKNTSEEKIWKNEIRTFRSTYIKFMNIIGKEESKN